DRVNVSKVCQDAIDQAVTAEGRIGGRDDRKARIVRRLVEAEEARVRLYRQAFRDGQSWAESAAPWPAPEKIAGWGSIEQADQITTTRPGPTFAVPALTLFQPLPKLYLPPGTPLAPKDVTAGQQVLYWRGLRDGVKSVYDLVKDAMEAPAPKG